MQCRNETCNAIKQNLKQLKLGDDSDHYSSSPTNTDLSVFIRILCVRMYGMLNYTDNSAEASGSEYAGGGSSAFEDEAYGDVSLAKMIVSWVYFSSRFLRPPIKKCAHTDLDHETTLSSKRAKVNKTILALIFFRTQGCDRVSAVSHCFSVLYQWRTGRFLVDFFAVREKASHVKGSTGAPES